MILDEQKADIEEKDQTIGALKRNFKSLSDIAMKAEQDKKKLEVIKISLE